MSATLVDTQAFLWLLDGNPKLSSRALARITEPESELFFSYASAGKANQTGCAANLAEN